MALDAELRTIAEAAAGYADGGEELVGVIPAEPLGRGRLYVCAYREGEETRWLVLDATAAPVEDRALVRDAVSIAGLVELAEDAAGAGAQEAARVATPAHLDTLGAKPRDRQAFLTAMKRAGETVDELVRDVQLGYKRSLR